MPTFDTPSPIDLAINLPVGAIEVIASDRVDTVVTVAPTNPDKAVDRRGADETTVDFDGERLTIKGPKPRISIIGPSESVDLRVELPTGSRLTAESSVGAVRTVGRLGATRIKASTGMVDVDAVADLWLRASHGSVVIGAADGSIEVTADHGPIRVGTVTGDAILKASHGSVQVDEVGGDLDAKLSYGDLEVGTAHASLTAKTAYGNIRIAEASTGSLQLDSGYGQVAVGIRDGVSAWLDLSSKGGRVRNELDGEAVPGGSDGSVAVRARTTFGDISIRRAQLGSTAKDNR